MDSGSLTLNGMTDEDLIKILEVKAKNEQLLEFNPHLTQPVNLVTPPGQRAIPRYNNVIVNWRSEEGAHLVADLLRQLAG